MNAPTVGSKGARLSGTQDGGTFAFEAFHDFEAAKLTVNFQVLDPEGGPVKQTLEGLVFLNLLSGARLQIAGEHGPFHDTGQFPSLDGDLPDADEHPQQEDAVLDAVRALAEIQDHCPRTLHVPNLNEVTRTMAHEWGVVARLLAGETVEDSRLGTLTTQLQEVPDERPDGNHAFYFVCQLAAQIGEECLDLGHQALHLSAARVESNPDDWSSLTVTPLEGAVWTRTRANDNRV